MYGYYICNFCYGRSLYRLRLTNTKHGIRFELPIKINQIVHKWCARQRVPQVCGDHNFYVCLFIKQYSVNIIVKVVNIACIVFCSQMN